MPKLAKDLLERAPSCENRIERLDMSRWHKRTQATACRKIEDLFFTVSRVYDESNTNKLNDASTDMAKNGCDVRQRSS